MPTVREIEAALFTMAPKAGAMEWDNVGHLVGDPEAQVSRVLVSLDITQAVAEEAIAAGTAAHRHPGHHPSRVGVADAVGAQRAANKGGKLRQRHGGGQRTHAADPVPAQWPRVLQPQRLGQGVVDAPLGNVQVRMHTHGRHVVLQQRQQQIPLGIVRPEGLHGVPVAVHHRKIGRAHV